MQKRNLSFLIKMTATPRIQIHGNLILSSYYQENPQICLPFWSWSYISYNMNLRINYYSFYFQIHTIVFLVLSIRFFIYYTRPGLLARWSCSLWSLQTHLCKYREELFVYPANIQRQNHIVTTLFARFNVVTSNK